MCHYLYDRNGNLKLKTQRKVGQHQLKIRSEEVSKKPKKFSFFVEEVKEDIGRKDLEYYLRNDRIYTKAEKEEYKRLKAEREKEILENDEWQRGDWEYFWNADGSLKSVKLPDGQKVSFEYDALGRRIKKIANGKIKRYLWDGNVLLHQWEYDKEDEPRKILNELGEISFDRKEPIENLTTWVYEENSFVPIAKIVGNEIFSIISDYIGRPIQAFDSFGNLVWQTEYDIYGKIRNLQGEKDFIPFRQLGQYEDIEVGLYYNRFRYYDPASGVYISKDPISILGGLNVYAYVWDSNTLVDVLGLYSDLNHSGMGHHLFPRKLAEKLNIKDLVEKISWYPNEPLGTAELHKAFHDKLAEAGIPRMPFKQNYKGTISEALNAMDMAYENFDIKGFLMVNGVKYPNLNPKEAMEKVRKHLEKKLNIGCKK